MRVETPYLDAIQAVPGDTPSEKFSWMARLLKERLAECDSLEDVVECEKIPRPLAPLMQIQAALMLNKKDRANQSAYSAIAEALKSEDVYVVRIALRARSFFDGTNRTITNVRYFFDNLFPHVSLRTRTRIIKNLALYLGPENSDLAEEFFTAVASFYDQQQALPLLLACSESFAYDTIVQKRIVLSWKLVKRMFRKNPDFVVRYIRLFKPTADPLDRNLRPLNILNFYDFLMALVKKRLDSFIELYGMIKARGKMSNKCAEAFLKNGKEHLLREPKLYIELLPIKMISASCMEAIFPKLFPENVKAFSTDSMLSYLEYYPQDKKVDFFLKSYRQVYGEDILDNTSKVTVKLMRILPSEERIRQARIKLETDSTTFSKLDYNTSWECYLNIEESLPLFKEKMAKTTEMELRSAIACKMIYCCKVNNDDQALQQVLSYLANRHKNEQPWFQMKIFQCLLDVYDLPQMGNDHWAILTDMIMRTHVKKEFNVTAQRLGVGIVEAAIHHKILQNQPIDQMIDVLMEIRCTLSFTSQWNILTKYPGYERICLEAFVRALERKYEGDAVADSCISKGNAVLNMALSIYDFNARHVNKASRVERMSIKNYPWLMASVEETLSKMTEKYTALRLKRVLLENERDIHDRLCPEEKDIIDSSAIEDLSRLKKNPAAVLARWEEYLEACKSSFMLRSTRRFMLAVRWYKDIPVRFVERCLASLVEGTAVVYYHEILALLVHGETYAKLIELYIPANKTMDVHDEQARRKFDLISDIVYGMRMANPPVPLTIVAKLCEGDYLPVVLTAIRSICRRTNATDVIAFARTLASQRVAVRKHGVRLMHMVAGHEQLFQFLRGQWKNEENHSMRAILFSKITRLFQDEPTPDAWSLLADTISTLTPNDNDLFAGALPLIDLTPDEYVVDFVKLAYTTIGRLEKAGVKELDIVSYTSNLLRRVNRAVCYLLPEDFIKEFLQRYFTHYELGVPKFVFTELLAPARDKFDDRMKLFSGVFTEIVKGGWNVPHPKNPRFYPVNHSVLEFVHAVNSFATSLKVEPRVIDEILSTFLSVLTPQMDPTSYLMLVYTQDRVASKTFKEFGARIGQRIPELVGTFSQLFTCEMVGMLATTLESIKFDRNNKSDMIAELVEGLAESGTLEATFMAVKMLPMVDLKQSAEKYDELLMRFLKHDHPLIKSMVYDINNRTEFVD